MGWFWSTFEVRCLDKNLKNFFGYGGHFRPRWSLGCSLRGIELVLAFLGVELVFFVIFMNVDSWMSGQGDLGFVSWRFHWVWNIKYNWFEYMVWIIVFRTNLVCHFNVLSFVSFSGAWVLFFSFLRNALRFNELHLSEGVIN